VVPAGQWMWPAEPNQLLPAEDGACLLYPGTSEWCSRSDDCVLRCAASRSAALRPVADEPQATVLQVDDHHIAVRGTALAGRLVVGFPFPALVATAPSACAGGVAVHLHGAPVSRLFRTRLLEQLDDAGLDVDWVLHERPTGLRELVAAHVATAGTALFCDLFEYIGDSIQHLRDVEHARAILGDRLEVYSVNQAVRGLLAYRPGSLMSRLEGCRREAGGHAILIVPVYMESQWPRLLGLVARAVQSFARVLIAAPGLGMAAVIDWAEKRAWVHQLATEDVALIHVPVEPSIDESWAPFADLPQTDSDGDGERHGVLVLPFASTPEKELPQDTTAALAALLHSRLGSAPTVVLRPGDERHRRYATALYPDVTIAEASLSQLAALAGGTGYVVAADSGGAHLALHAGATVIVGYMPGAWDRGSLVSALHRSALGFASTSSRHIPLNLLGAPQQDAQRVMELIDLYEEPADGRRATELRRLLEDLDRRVAQAQRADDVLGEWNQARLRINASYPQWAVIFDAYDLDDVGPLLRDSRAPLDLSRWAYSISTPAKLLRRWS